MAVTACSRHESSSAPTQDRDATTDDPAESENESESPELSDSDKGQALSNQVKLGEPSLTAGIPGEGKLTNEQIDTWLANPDHHAELEVELPLGLAAGASQIKGLDKNPLTRAKIELGRQLYFDTRLSSDNTISCASCHDPEHGYAADTQFGVGVDDQTGDMNSPVAYNRILSDKQFWDGRAGTLEEQAVGPIANPIEMANTHEQAVATVKDIDGYRKQFEKIFPGEGVTIDNIGKAIASFERAIVTGPSPFDYHERLRAYADMTEEDFAEIEEEEPEEFARYQQMKATAKAHPMSESAQRGRDLFFGQKANCSACHVGANLTDEKYHNLGVGMDKDADKIKMGRFTQTKDEKDKGAHKTPTIRNVAQTPPYMHDGSMATLEEVVQHYVDGGLANPWLSKDIVKLKLTEGDQKDLVEFMKACTGSLPPVETERLPQ